jgi:hypothetical protein
MTSTFIELSEDAFDALFPLIPNHLNPNATWCLKTTGGCLFETFGAEIDFVRKHNPRAVWTLIDGDNGMQNLISGVHLVNRVGYLVCTVLLPEGVEAQVPLDQPDRIGGDHENH